MSKLASRSADTVTDTVREVTGADPRPIQDWLDDARASFVGRPADLPPPTFQAAVR